MLDVLQARKGVRVQGPLVTLIANGNGGALPIFQVSNYGFQIGVRSFRIKRIKILNAVAPPVNTLVHIGVGAAGVVVDIIPAIATIAGQNTDFMEADLPEVEISVDLMAWAVITAAAPNSVFIQVEVEELG